MNSKAQIQSKFWGLELSKTYPSLRYAGNIIANRCESLEVHDGLNQIIAEQGVFGGNEWDYAGFYFFESSVGQTLYMVSFFNKYKTILPAKRTFDLLAEALTDKYGTPIIKEDETVLLNLWGKKSEDACCLLKANQEGNLIIISLDYINQSVLQESIQQNRNEL